MNKFKKLLNVLAWIFGFPFKMILNARRSGRNGGWFKILLVPVFIVYFFWILFVCAFCSAFANATSHDKDVEYEPTNPEIIAETIVEDTVNTSEITIETEVTESTAIVTTVVGTENTVVETVPSESIEVTQTATENTGDIIVETTTIETSEVVDDSTVFTTETTVIETVPLVTEPVPTEPAVIESTPTEQVVSTTVIVSGDSQERHEYIRNTNNGKIHLTSCSWGPEEQNRETVYLTDEELANSDRCHRCFSY